MTPIAAETSAKSHGSKTALPWLDSLRKAGAARFAEVGYPSHQIEEWRFTNIAPIMRTQFVPALGNITAEARRLAQENAFGPEAEAELVFINGFFSAELSRLGKLPSGANVKPFSQATSPETETIIGHLGKLADLNQNPFIALNNSALNDGVLIHLKRGVELHRPIHLLFITANSDGPSVSHPRVLVVLENAAHLSLVSSFNSGSGTHLCNSVTEVFSANDSRFDFNRIQCGTDESLAISSFHAKVERGSQLISHAATLGGKVTRNDLNVILAGTGADATINGLVLLQNQQHCDNHTLLDHAAEHCPSHELYKHVLADKSSGVFRGKILVRPGAQKTDSKQTSKSLLLSDDAAMNSQPALEIYADDVKCTHGSTTGPVDEEMVFYLRSRGLSLETAKHLLTYAFAADVTRRIRVEPVRRRLEDYLAAARGLPRDLRITDLGEHDEKAR